MKGFNKELSKAYLLMFIGGLLINTNLLLTHFGISKIKPVFQIK